jgi:hypothetical protein
MATNFGAPTFVTSHNRKDSVIQWKSRWWDGCVLEFSLKGKHPKKEYIKYYRCIACFELYQTARLANEKCPVAHITVDNSVIVSDPDNPTTPHSCDVGEANGKSAAKDVLAKRYMYEKRDEIQKSRKRPRTAFDEAVTGVDARFGEMYDDEVTNGVKAKLSTRYGFNSKRRALSDNRSKLIIKNNSLEDLHADLKITNDKSVFLRKYSLATGREMLIYVAGMFCFH